MAERLGFLGGDIGRGYNLAYDRLVNFSKAVMESALNHIEDKVDISVHFKNNAEEKDVLAIKDSVAKLSEVKSVEYVRRDKALEDFKERHKDNATLLQSIEELDKTPEERMINIKAKEISQYGSVAKFLESKSDSFWRFHNR